MNCIAAFNRSIFSRHALAAMHFNFNLNRDVRTNEDGSSQITVHYPKFKNGEATIKDVRVQQNFGELSLYDNHLCNQSFTPYRTGVLIIKMFKLLQHLFDISCLPYF